MTFLATKLSSIGKDVSASDSIKQAIQMAGLDWSVELEQLKGSITGKLVDKNAVLRLDTQEHLGVVGEQYTPLQNTEAFNFFEPFIEQGHVRLETAGCFYGGRKIFVLGKIDMEDLEIQRDDTVQSYILFSNSHDGSTAVRIGFTPIRVWCTNTLKTAHNDAASKLIRIRHTHQVQLNVKEIQATMNTINQQFITTAENYRWLAERDIVKTDLEKYVRQVFSLKSLEELAKSDEEDSKAGTKIIDYVEEKFEDEPHKNWWAAYNSIQNYLQWNGNDAQRNYHSLWFGRNDSLNQKALNLALELAT